jgi:hypothetical protein
MKTMKKWGICISAVFWLLLIIAVVFGVVAYKKAVRGEMAFVFARDISAFVDSKGHLPTSVQEFCQSTLDSKGRPVWDIETTTNMVRFLWLSPGVSGFASNHLFEVIAPGMKKYEKAMNENIVGPLSPNILEQLNYSSTVSTEQTKIPLRP